MQVYRISKCKYINDLSGTGAARYAARWHSKGTHILYTAASPSLALLESVVHISSLIIANYCITCLDIPDNNIEIISVKNLPEDWAINPSPDKLKRYGDAFITDNKYLALSLPSAIMPEENNYLLNPNHADFKLVKIVYTREVRIDERLVGK